MASLHISNEDASLENIYVDGCQDFSILRLGLLAKLIQILISCPDDLSQKTGSTNMYQAFHLERNPIYFFSLIIPAQRSTGIQITLLVLGIGNDFEGIASEEALLKLSIFCEKIKEWIGLQSLGPSSQSPAILFNHIMKHCMPFLRCSAILFHFLTGVQAPSVLQDSTNQLPPCEELQTICGYLALPNNIIDILPFDGNEPDRIHFTESMIKRWCAHDHVKKLASNVTSENIGTYVEANRLIPLPKDYSTLISAASGFKCPITSDASRNPALCLICGEMICSQSYCCQALVDEKQIGSCTAHAETCSDGLGIFLRVRECEILLLYNGNKGCFLPSPYLDAYGEPDHGFRRGNPLFLCSERYNNLQCLWLSHSVTEEIVRRMESSRSLLSYDWAQL